MKMSPTLTGKKHTKRQLQEYEQNIENTHDNTLPTQENQKETTTGVDNEQNMENTLDNIQSVPGEENDPEEFETISDTNISSEMNASNRES